MKVLGLCGFAGSGKGTVADILVQRYSFKKISFADGVKDATAAIFHWPRHLLEGDTEESRLFREQPDKWWSDKFGYDVTPRYMLQLMGTEAGRNVFHEDVWIHALDRRLEDGINYVIPDVRFHNEMEMVRRKGYVVLTLRGELPEWYGTAVDVNIADCPASAMDKYNIHYSEWAHIGHHVDFTIYNDGTLAELEQMVDDLVKGI